MKFILFIIIIIFFILMYLLFFTKPKPEPEVDNGYCTGDKRFMPNALYNDSFYDCELKKFGICPDECAVFDYDKQKCVRGTRNTSICSKYNLFGNVPHFLDCSRFFMCASTTGLPFTCSQGLCFDIFSSNCVTRENCNHICFECENNCEIECE